jgi:hypothetical protein
MTIPKWNDPKLKAGTKIKAALWLVSEVGVGNTFTKEQLRQAFPGVTQIDRRVRELRAHGWVIDTRAEDVALNHDEQRFVATGQPIWQREGDMYDHTGTISAKIRRKTFAEDDYQCVTCGIAGGETYPEAPHIKAVLSLSRRSIRSSEGVNSRMLVTECQRCRAGIEGRSEVDVANLLRQIEALDAPGLAVFRRWVVTGRRRLLDRLWGEFRRLPYAAQNDIRKRLKPPDSPDATGESGRDA